MPPFDSPYEKVSGIAKAIIPGEKERQAREAERKAREECLSKGGKWDAERKVCILPQAPAGASAQPPKATPTSPETFVDRTGRPSGISLPDGRSFLGLSPDEVNEIAAREQEKTQLPAGAPLVGTAQNAVNTAFQNQQLQGQVGQFQESPLQNPPLFDAEQALSQGVVGAIPRALSLAVTGAGIGLAGGAAAGAGVASPVTAPAGAAIGAVAGFVTGIAGTLISQAKSQRAATVNAQKRVLDEGKQTMKDWATLAEADPANAPQYLSEYNKVAAQINQAYRQMKYDTQRDLAKFEDAVPDLAEFEAFYSAGGEFDALNADMRNALLSPASAEYKMLELAQRRGALNGS